MARNAVVDAARRRGARRQRDRDVTTLGRSPGRTPEELMLAAELGETLVEHIERLPEARRDAVTRYIRGERVPEIAEATGESPKRVENLVYRGLRSLRQSLSDAGVRP
jgi:RNA polymerase sigma factor (sigma-70 family)